MTNAEKNLRELFFHLLYSAGDQPSIKAKQDFDDRELVVTPFDGCYGRAGWVLAMNGSPPRGILVSTEASGMNNHPAQIFYIRSDKSKRIGPAQAEVVRTYLKSLPEIES